MLHLLRNWWLLRRCRSHRFHKRRILTSGSGGCMLVHVLVGLLVRSIHTASCCHGRHCSCRHLLLLLLLLLLHKVPRMQTRRIRRGTRFSSWCLRGCSLSLGVSPLAIRFGGSLDRCNRRTSFWVRSDAHNSSSNRF